MQKNDAGKKFLFSKDDLTSLALGTLIGNAALCLTALLFSVGMLCGILPLRWIGFYSAASLFSCGLLTTLSIGGRGRMILFSFLALFLLLSEAFLVGHLLFGGAFTPAQTPLLPTTMFVGLILGSALANFR